MKNPKDIQYYLDLNYEIIIKKIESDGETGFEAYTRELSRDSFYGIGDTPAEAVESLEEVKKELFPYYLEKGYQIPEPEPEEDLPSGRFVVRIAPKTHRELIRLASKYGQSLNMLINDIFSNYNTSEKICDMAGERLRMEIGRCISKLESAYNITGFKGETKLESELNRYEGEFKATA